MAFGLEGKVPGERTLSGYGGVLLLLSLLMSFVVLFLMLMFMTVLEGARRTMAPRLAMFP